MAHLRMCAKLLLATISTLKALIVCVVGRTPPLQAPWASCLPLPWVYITMSPQILTVMVMFFVFHAQRRIYEQVMNFHVFEWFLSRVCKLACMLLVC